MKLLKELTNFKATKEQIKESIDSNNGILKLKGVIQRADIQNANGRVYPKDVLEREIENYKKLVRERRAHGELDHADDPVVNLKNISHIISDIWIDDEGTVLGEVEVLPTPMGNILRALIESEVTVGISSRALGSVIHDGANDVVQEDLHFICWDFVSEPSTPGAYMFKEAREVDPKVLGQIFSRDVRVDRVANEILELDRKLRGNL